MMLGTHQNNTHHSFIANREVSSWSYCSAATHLILYSLVGQIQLILYIMVKRFKCFQQQGLVLQASRIAEGQENEPQAVAKGGKAGSAFGFTIFEDTAPPPVPALAQRQESCEDEPMMDLENLTFHNKPESFDQVAQYLVHPLELIQPSPSAMGMFDLMYFC